MVRTTASGSSVSIRSVSFPSARTSTTAPRDLTTIDGDEPRKVYRAHFSPPSILSRRKEKQPSSILRKAVTGVSMSAMISR
jgi:hypothetical protein